MDSDLKDKETDPQHSGTVEVFRMMESQGLCDGFLWPYEGGRIRDLRWVDGEKAVAYETSRGTLWMRNGEWKYYGFTDEHQFAKAAKSGRLLASKPRGIITVGALRIRKTGGKIIYLLTPDCPVKFQFVTNSPSEEAEISDILANHFKNSRIFATGGFLGGVHFPTNDFWKTFREAMGGPHRHDLMFLVLLGGVGIVFTLAGVFVPQLLLGGVLVAFFFVLMVIRFCEKTGVVR